LLQIFPFAPTVKRNIRPSRLQRQTESGPKWKTSTQRKHNWFKSTDLDLLIRGLWAKSNKTAAVGQVPAGAGAFKSSTWRMAVREKRRPPLMFIKSTDPIAWKVGIPARAFAPRGNAPPTWRNPYWFKLRGRLLLSGAPRFGSEPAVSRTYAE